MLPADVIIAIFLLLGLLSMILWIAALIDVAKSEFRGPNDKLVWIVVVVVAGFIGAIVYFAVGRSQKISRW